MRLNKPVPHRAWTHERAPAFAHMTAEQELRRSVLSCLLWEDEFYEDGQSIAKRIVERANQVSTETLAALAIEARKEYHLRHVPLILLEALTHRQGRIVGETIAEVISRADEITEFVAIYSRNERHPLSAQMKLGLAQAFNKFDRYQFSKYNRKGQHTFRSVMSLVRPKPKNAEQEQIFKDIMEGALTAPDTWEVAFSSGAGKKETFERLIREQRLGYMALLRNLRKMEEVGVNRELVKAAIEARKGAKNVLPFRFLAAAQAAPSFEKELDFAVRATIEAWPQLPGQTLILVDVSGSMSASLSGKSRMRRRDAAAMLGAMLNGDIYCFAFATDCVEVPHRIGMSGVDAYQNARVGHGTNIGYAIEFALDKYPSPNRIIVITDGQSYDIVGDPQPPLRGYFINVGSYANSVGYGPWTMVDGFSETTIRFILEFERSQQ